MFEAGVILVGVVSLIALVTSAQSIGGPDATDPATLVIAGQSLVAVRDVTPPRPRRRPGPQRPVPGTILYRARPLSPHRADRRADRCPAAAGLQRRHPVQRQRAGLRAAFSSGCPSPPGNSHSASGIVIVKGFSPATPARRPALLRHGRPMQGTGQSCRLTPLAPCGAPAKTTRRPSSPPPQAGQGDAQLPALLRRPRWMPQEAPWPLGLPVAIPRSALNNPD